MIVAARNIQAEYSFQMPFIRLLNKFEKNEIANWLHRLIITLQSLTPMVLIL